MPPRFFVRVGFAGGKYYDYSELGHKKQSVRVITTHINQVFASIEAVLPRFAVVTESTFTILLYSHTGPTSDTDNKKFLQAIRFQTTYNCNNLPESDEEFSITDLVDECRNMINKLITQMSRNFNQKAFGIIVDLHHVESTGTHNIDAQLGSVPFQEIASVETQKDRMVLSVTEHTREGIGNNAAGQVKRGGK